ncbi:hypothetical protein Q8A67_024494 [Cirrhinus molitorella]|uniref:Uncharacterized protein n=1 Tax=Cirrhinus molitorella TaxID=172907 RepID=A0AA88P4I3_9TELE|nr:hypothetical protein Q8A67_024494 [Cirrhinus molitorella]
MKIDSVVPHIQDLDHQRTCLEEDSSCLRAEIQELKTRHISDPSRSTHARSGSRRHGTHFQLCHTDATQWVRLDLVAPLGPSGRSRRDSPPSSSPS